LNVDLNPSRGARTGVPGGDPALAAGMRCALDYREVMWTWLRCTVPPNGALEADFAIPHELVYYEMYIRRDATPLRSLSNIVRQTNSCSGPIPVVADALIELGHGIICV